MGSIVRPWIAATAAALGLGVAFAAGCGGDSGGTTDAGGDVTTTACGNAGTLCGGTCVSTQSDNANCGACGTVCASGEVCSQGKCATSCGGGTKLCGSTCADTKNDPQNCGACGTKCGAGQVCSAGACGNTCSSGQTFCGGDGGAPYCANTKTDNANCGGCGVTCGSGQVCDDGACASSCAGDDAGTETLCTPDGGAPYCANTTSDKQNCGACGNVCGTGTVCQNGACTNACAAEDGGLQTLCTPDGGPSYCADTSTDSANCGSCGDVCAANAACVAGVCKLLAVSRIIFVSSVQYPANLGGLTGADAKCQTLASAASLSGTYKAWLSDDTTSAASRLVHFSGPYVLSDGTTVVADDWTQLTSGTLLHAVDLTETGGAPPTTTYCGPASSPTVYTDTSASGATKAQGANCGNWTGTGTSIVWGNANLLDDQWTDWCSGAGGGFCDGTYLASIYCIQQ